MIVKKHYYQKVKNGCVYDTWEIEGWYLFGIIPLYVKKTK